MDVEPHAAIAPLVTSLLADRLDRFRSIARELDQPDADAVHRLRVGARRLYAALTVTRPLAQFPSTVLRRPVRRIERRFGALRDLDVLAGLLDDLPAEDAGVAELRRSLLRERDEAWERGAAALERRGLRRVLSALAEWLDAPAFSPVASMGPALLLPDLLGPALSRLFLQPGWLVAGVPAPDDPQTAELHALRRHLKALRYRMECLTSWCRPAVGDWLDELHTMQDALGTWHDLGVLLRRLGAAGGSEEVNARLRARAVEALAPWPGWRDRYLDPAFRAEARRRVAPLAAAGL